MTERKKRKEYSFEIVETAECLYIYRQKTYEEISKITGVSVAQIQRWSEKYEWRKKRLEYVKAQTGFRRDLYDLRIKLIQKAIETQNAQDVHAMANLQRIIDSVEKGKALEDLPADPEKGLGLSPETLRKIREEVYGIRPKISDPAN
jgi:transposase